VIPPIEIPSSSAVSDAATTLGAALDGLDDALLGVRTKWSGLSAVYSAPEAHIAYGALSPLTGAGDDMVTALTAAETALSTYAQTLSTLETRRTSIMADIALINSGVDLSERPGFVYEVTADRNQFNTDAQAADDDCAAALRTLRENPSWVIEDALGPITSNAGGAVQGLGAELLQRYRGTLLVPGPGALLPDELTLTASMIEPTWPRQMIDGQVYVTRPSGLVVLESTLLPDASTPPTVRLQDWDARPQFTTTPDVGAPPQWARYTGKALGVAGAGFTFWSVHAESYNDTLIRHPDWTEEQRQEEAIVDTAVVGGAAVAGGAGGAWGGAAAGAAIGSIFPGPGTLIGGIVGGIIGGVAGGWAGQEVAQQGVDAVRGDTDADEMIMAPGAEWNYETVEAPSA
jgi:hypothetical protein